MKQSSIILIIAGSMLVALPIITEQFAREHASFQDNYHKAMDRMAKKVPNQDELSQHRESLRQAEDLRPSHLPGYLAQFIGGGMIVIGILATRSRSESGASHEAIKATGLSGSIPTRAMERKQFEAENAKT